MKMVIRNGRVMDPANNKEDQHDIYIADGKIVALNSVDSFTPDKEVDANQKIISPGLVDLCAHLREPGQEYKATICSETRAAVKAGITTLCCWPDTYPIMDTPAVIELIQQRAQSAGFAKVKSLAALTVGLKGEQLTEMSALKQAGCVGVSNIYHPIFHTTILRHAFEYAATQDLTVFITPEDYWLAENGCIHEGCVSTRLGLPGIPDVAESIDLVRNLQLIEHTGVRAHFSRLTTSKSVELIRRAKEQGLPVTADVAAHQLFLSEMDVLEFDSFCHIRPPLRSLTDQALLIQAVKEGVIDAICSHHQPHEQDAKLQPFPESLPGISALETFLPLSLRLVDKHFSLLDVLKKITSNPAKILGIEAGTLKVGSPADLCIFDANHEFTLTKESLYSRGQNTPFIGWDFKGYIAMTIMNGQIVYE